MDEGDGTLNLRGVATVLALSRYVKRKNMLNYCISLPYDHFLLEYSLWARDIIFIISDGYMEGMQAWLSEYHGVTQSSTQPTIYDLNMLFELMH